MMLVAALILQVLTGRVFAHDDVKTPLSGASVYFKELDKGTATGLNGTFIIKGIPDGTWQLRVSFIGYKELTTTVTLPKADPVEFVLEPEMAMLSEVLVTSTRQPSVQLEQNRISTISITAFPIATMPRLLGEADLLRMVQNLPGVKSESDFTGGFSVRGGRNDQNLILLDGVQIYNPWHLFGIFSAFNTEAISEAELAKGVFPVNYGSRLSSVLDIRLQNGSRRKGFGYLNITPLSASFSYGRPINQYTSYLVALRRTYFDPIFLITDRLSSSPETVTLPRTESNTGYQFTDATLKLVHRFKDNSTLDLHGFYGSDWLTSLVRNSREQGAKYKQKDNIRIGWHNSTLSARHRFANSTLNISTQAFITRYSSVNKFSFTTVNDTSTREIDNNNNYYTVSTGNTENFSQQFVDVGLQQDARFFYNSKASISAGWQVLNHRFQDQSIRVSYDDGFLIGDRPANTIRQRNEERGDSSGVQAVESSLYTSLNLKFGAWAVFPGVRLQHYSKGNFIDILPRITIQYEVTPETYVVGGYGHFAQYVSTVGLDLIRLPTDRWFWANANRQPARAQTATFGIRHDHPSLGAISFEAYTKKYDGLLAFGPEDQNLAMDGDLPLFGSQTVSGTGHAYGTELLWQRTAGRHSGWLGYTLSWANNTFRKLNNGKEFPTRTDRRHDIQAFWNVDISKNFSIGTVFNFKTGQPVTLPLSGYIPAPDPMTPDDFFPSDLVVTDLNNFRMPAYHRLDVSFTLKNRRFLWRKAEWSLNVLNVYNRRNVLTVYGTYLLDYNTDGSITVTPQYRYLTQFPILPMVSVRIALGGDAI